jgi:chemotaxis response regulator CheB
VLAKRADLEYGSALQAGPIDAACWNPANTIAARNRMPIAVLLVEDSDVMRLAIKRVLNSEPTIELLGEAVDLPEALQMTAELKPNVVLMDLHLPGEREFSPEFIKSQLLLSAKYVVMMSLSEDEEATALAKRYGAITLLDKSNLQASLIPSILQLA